MIILTLAPANEKKKNIFNKKVSVTIFIFNELLKVGVENIFSLLF